MKIFFSATNSFYGSAIRQFEGGDYNHTGFIMPNGKVIDASNDLGVYEHQSIAGIQAASFRFCVYEVFLPNEEAGINFLLRQVGKGYDKLSIAGFVIQRDWQNEDEWCCSEMLAAFYKYAEMPIAGSEKYNRVPVRLTHAVTHALAHGQRLVLG